MLLQDPDNSLSYVSFRGQGFWSRGYEIEQWSNWLLESYDRHPELTAWANELVRRCEEALKRGFFGVSSELDPVLPSWRHLDAVLVLAEEAHDHLLWRIKQKHYDAYMLECGSYAESQEAFIRCAQSFVALLRQAHRGAQGAQLDDAEAEPKPALRGTPARPRARRGTSFRLLRIDYPARVPKPQLAVGILGQDGHGKTSLCEALTHCSAAQGLGAVRTAIEMREIPGALSWCEQRYSAYPVLCETAARRYTLFDFPRHEDAVHALSEGFPALDALIAVIRAGEEGLSQLEEQLVAWPTNLPAPILFLNLCGRPGDAVVDRQETQLRALLSRLGFYGDETAIIRGSALATTGEPGSSPPALRVLDALDGLPLSL